MLIYLFFILHLKQKVFVWEKSETDSYFDARNQSLQLLSIKALTLQRYTNILIFKNNVWVASLADMQLIGKFNKGFLFLLSAIDVYSKYT